jgi:hypothetical protein
MNFDKVYRPHSQPPNQKTGHSRHPLLHPRVPTTPTSIAEDLLCFKFLFGFVSVLVVGIGCRASCMLSTCSTTELYPQP